MENATNHEGSHPFETDRDKWAYSSGPGSLEPGYEELDTADTLKWEREEPFAGEVNPAAPGREATAGVAPNGRESVQGKDEQDESFDYFRFLMETNEPPQGISATNRDWVSIEPPQ